MRKNKLLSIICAIAMMMTMFSSFVVANAADGEPQAIIRIPIMPSATNDTFKVEVLFSGIPDDRQVSGFQVTMPIDTTKFEVVKTADDKWGDDKFGETAYGTRGGASMKYAFAPTAGADYRKEKSCVVTTWTLKLIDADATIGVSEYPISLTSAKLTLAGNGVSDLVYGLASDSGTTNTYTANMPEKITVEEKKEASDPVITGVTVTPAKASVKLGETQKFTADVTGTNGLDQDLTTEIPFSTDVTWTVAGGKSADTKIAADGTLTVGADETEKALTVTATSVGKGADGNAVTGTAEVTISSGNAVELTTAADTAVGDYKPVTVTATAGDDADAVAAFKAAVAGNKLVLLATGKTNDNVVVGSAYVVVDGDTLAAGVDAGIAIGSLGITGADKYEVALIDASGNVVAK